jgi:glucosamine--fructose-6-phosphate aminotransferase (isomerizing)
MRPPALGSSVFNWQDLPHFMGREIHAQPQVIRTCLQTHFRKEWCPDALDSPFQPGLPIEVYTDLDQIHLIACGSSYHACLVGQYWLEQIVGIPTRVRLATEFQSAPFPSAPDCLTIAVTQSGETADTLAAVELARLRGSDRILGITNQPDSSLSRLVDQTLLTPAGVEIGVAATKTFTAQLLLFFGLALDLAVRRQALDGDRVGQMLAQVHQIPTLMEHILQQEDCLHGLVASLLERQHCIVLGRGVNHAIALEGALKLKETTYIHAEGYAAGEFMHGPVAFLDANVPVIAIAPAGNDYSKLLPNLRKIKGYQAPVLGITTSPAADHDLFDAQISLPLVDQLLSPFLSVLPLQLLAYRIAVLRGLDVDRPRHITKAITGG